MKLESAANGHRFFATPRRLGSSVHGATGSFEIDSKMLFGLGWLGLLFLYLLWLFRKGGGVVLFAKRSPQLRCFHSDEHVISRKALGLGISVSLMGESKFD